MIPVTTTTMARTLNHGLGLCVTSLDEAGLLIASGIERGSIGHLYSQHIMRRSPHYIDSNCDN